MNDASRFERKIPPLWDHQTESVDFFSEITAGYDASDPGTAKTRVHVEVFSRRLAAGESKRLLVLATKSILQPAWGNDIEKFAPHLTYSIASAKNRLEAFEMATNIVITNHDAIKWIMAQGKDFLQKHGFTDIVVDEITAFKHRTSQRSKALMKAMSHFKHKYGLSGTPNPNTILDVWHQYKLLDDGEHLGNNFFKFRNVMCSPTQVGPDANMVQWADREGADLVVADLVEDMTKRHVFEEVFKDMPENTTHTVEFSLSPKHRRQYEKLAKDSILELNSGEEVSALHAGALATKLLQCASGAVYDAEGETQVLNSQRCELVMDLIEQRSQCLVAFNWKHQRDELLKLADKKGLTYGLIDGSVKDKDRNDVVELFQRGKIQVIFAHPMSASHGLTLTKGVATIWTSPIYDAERYQQFNRRIYRAGQKNKTETIHIAAENTLDAGVYEKMQTKLNRMLSLLELLQEA